MLNAQHEVKQCNVMYFTFIVSQKNIQKAQDK